MSAGAVVAAWALAVFGTGAVIIGLYGLREPAKARELWAVYASTLAIAAALLVPLALHPLVFTLVVAAGAWRGAIELATTYDLRPDTPRRLAIAGGALLAAGWGSTQGDSAAALYIATAALVAIAGPVYVRAFSGKPSGIAAWLATLTFPLLAAAHLSHLAHLHNGFTWIVLLYATVETQDSAAYLFGRLFGRRLLLPRLSPKKTVAGAVAGALCGLALGAAGAWGLLDLAPAAALALAALIVAAGFCGDLYTSALKRGAGVKDFPAVTTLHGGILDIYDSTLFAAVVLSSTIYIIAPWTS
ncbi:MAG TPA: phosphatidate cytidylyltransferase [Burkholderiales bacterium]|nr:phosphatidate cytidylyltransferase [Burkholderiales bacterium]